MSVIDQKWRERVVAGLLIVHAGLVGWISLRMSPTMDEGGHLAAGLYAWKFGRFDVYRVNPPLVRMIAALPVVACDPCMRWDVYAAGPAARPEWSLGDRLIEAIDRGDRAWFWSFVTARWACIPLSLVGGYTCWRWATDLYGANAGLVALGLWCFSPNMLAWTATICPDAGAAAVGVSACYVYWRWLQGPSWSRAAGAGVGLGLALLTKTTWIILLGVWPLLWLVWRWDGKGRDSREVGRASCGQLIAIFVLGTYLLNAGYAFEGSFKRLGEYVFVSRSFGVGESRASSGSGGNRFAGTWLARVPVPMPANYLRGIDLQKADFEQGKWSYLRGEWKHGGWWYYYVYAALLKVPLGTWTLGLLAALLSISVRWPTHNGYIRNSSERGANPYWAGWRQELILVAPAVVVFVLVSSQTGFSRYFRYVLPCFPFVFIWISKVARSIRLRHRVTGFVAGAAFLWSAGSSLWYFPHSMSYINEFKEAAARRADAAGQTPPSRATFICLDVLCEAQFS